MIHLRLLMVFLRFSSLFFTSSTFFLSDFISWPLPSPVSCFQITLLPKGQALLYHLPLFIPHTSLSSGLTATRKIFPPSCHLRPPSPLISFFSFTVSKDQTRASALCCSFPPKEKKKFKMKLLYVETRSLQHQIKGYNRIEMVDSETWIIKTIHR